MSSKNPPEFYDESYLHMPLRWAGGATRFEDTGSFYQAACFIQEFLAERGANNPRIGRRWLWTNILVVEQGESPEAEQAHHRNVVSRLWWREQFQIAGWREMDCLLLTRFFDLERDHCQ